MKLELKHLAAYLPYGLSVIDKNDGSLSTLNCIDIEEIDGIELKPLLRPLSDLTKEIEKYGLVYYKNCSLCIADFATTSALGMEDVLYITEKLLSNHYDIFGLIPAGLAIDINTIEI